MQIIKTERLLLRALTPEIYNEVFSTYTEDGLMKFFGCRTSAELEEERKRNTQGLRMYKRSFLSFQLIEKEGGDVIGSCGFHSWYLTHFRAEIGYGLSDDAHKRKGYMKEALPAVLD